MASSASPTGGYDMRVFSLLVAVSLLISLQLARGVRAEERYVAFAENRGWTIQYDRQENNCIAAPKGTDGGLFFVRPSSSEVVVLIASTKLSWLTDEKDYKVDIRTNSRPWNGTMRADVADGSGGLYLVNPNEAFLTALRGASRLSLSVENVNYGPFSLAGSNDTIKQLLECAQALERGEFKSEVPEPAEAETINSDELVSWSAEDFGKSYSVEGWTLSLTGQDNPDGTGTALLRAEKDGKGETTIKLETSPEGRGFGGIGVYKLDWSDPAVVFTSFTGGAHCCTEARIAVATDNGIKVIELGMFDGASVKPEDLEGDGTFEFELSDQRFLYAFSSYADSVPPVQILALRDGEVADVTKDAAFRPVVERALIRTMTLCSEEQGSGACAGALGNAALLGLYRSAFEFMVFDEINAKMEDSFLECGGMDACKGRGDFKDFQDAVTFRLRDWGYETESRLSDAASAFMEELAKAEAGFGAPSDDTENGCSMGPTVFRMERAKGIADFRGYEHICNIENASVLHNAIATDALCAGEGDYWLDNHIFERDGDDLWVFSLGGARAGVAPARLSRCAKTP